MRFFCHTAKKSKAATGLCLPFAVMFYNNVGAVTYVTFLVIFPKDSN